MRRIFIMRLRPNQSLGQSSMALGIFSSVIYIYVTMKSLLALLTLMKIRMRKIIFLWQNATQIRKRPSKLNCIHYLSICLQLCWLTWCSSIAVLYYSRHQHTRTKSIFYRFVELNIAYKVSSKATKLVWTIQHKRRTKKSKHKLAVLVFQTSAAL